MQQVQTSAIGANSQNRSQKLHKSKETRFQTLISVNQSKFLEEEKSIQDRKAIAAANQW